MNRRIDDQAFLKNDQYKDAGNLERRINLHQRFGTARYPWFRWVFDQLDLQAGKAVLEVGCGPGRLWAENLDRCPPGLRVLLGDLSIGMARQARSITGGQPTFRYLTLDAQAVPFHDGLFDRVIANHMLYHVPDIHQALGEFRRGLNPGGWLCAATNGIFHMRELHELVHEFDPGYPAEERQIERFSLETGPKLLAEFFPQVQVRLFEDHLIVTEAGPLVEYILSMFTTPDALRTNQADGLKQFVERKLQREGRIVIHKAQGLVIGGRG